VRLGRVVGKTRLVSLLESYDLAEILSAELGSTRELSHQRKSFLAAPDRFRFSTGHRQLFSCSLEFWLDDFVASADDSMFHLVMELMMSSLKPQTEMARRCS